MKSDDTPFLLSAGWIDIRYSHQSCVVVAVPKIQEHRAQERRTPTTKLPSQPCTLLRMIRCFNVLITREAAKQVSWAAIQMRRLHASQKNFALKDAHVFQVSSAP